MATQKYQFATVNSRSIKPKEYIILEVLNEYKIDLLVTTETWLKNTVHDQQWLQGSELIRNGFQTLPINRKTRTGGGIVVTVKSSITVKQQNSAEYNSFEHTLWNINHKGIPTFRVIDIYHPPSNCQNSTDSTFIDQLTDLLTTLQAKYNNIIILEDISMHMDDPRNRDALVLCDSLYAFDLTHMLEFQPTVKDTHLM